MSIQSPIRQLLLRYRQGLLALGLVIVSSTLILFNGTPGVMQPAQIGLTVFSTVEGTFSGVLNVFIGGIQNVSELLNIQKKYLLDKEKLQNLSGATREVVTLRDENARLKKLLNFQSHLAYQSVAAQIIAKDPTKIFSAFTIDKGFLDGIRKNFPVVSYQGSVVGLVGKVAEVGLTTAIVQPILDGNMFVAAQFVNTRFQGLVSGKGNNEQLLKMNYVDKSAKDSLTFGDLVDTSGLDSLYPAGILIGRVKAINAQEYDTSLEIELDPVISFSTLEYVDVLKVTP